MTWQIGLSLGIIGVFLAVMVCLGRYATRFSDRSLGDYVTARGGLGPIAAFWAVSATWISTVSYLGSPGWFFLHGLAFILWVGYGMTWNTCFYLWGGRLQALGQKRGYLSQGEMVGDFFESRIVQLLVFLAGFLAVIPYVQAQFMALGYMLSFATGGWMPVGAGSALAVGVVLYYVLSGGLRATAFTNIVQGGILSVGLLVTAGILLWHVGGLFELIEKVRDQAGAGHFTIPGSQGEITYSMWFSYILVFGVGSFLLPHIVIRAFATRDTHFYDKYPFYNHLLFWVLMPPMIVIGFAALLLVPNAKPDQALPEVLTVILPLPVVGLILLGGISAGLSSVDGQSHALATMVMNDVVRSSERAVSEKRLLQLTRTSVVAVIALAFVLGFVARDYLFALVAVSFGFAMAIGPAMIGALMAWRRATRVGAITSIAGGLAAVVIFTFILPDFLGFLGGIWGGLSALILFVVVSFLTTSRPSKQKLEEFELALGARNKIQQSGYTFVDNQEA